MCLIGNALSAVSPECPALEPLADSPISDITSLIDPKTGAVAGDRWGEQDTRFSYIAVSILSLIGRLDVLDTALDGKARDLLVGYIARCRNFDGGFGATEGSESHGGQS